MPHNIIIAVTGASGSIYAYNLLKLLKKDKNIITHLILSDAAAITIKQELDISVSEFKLIADKTYKIQDIAATIASGSNHIDSMIILPCSIKTMSEIACSISGNLISRSADVTLKERRKLIIGLRETPLHSIHIDNLKRLSDAGAIIYPLIPAFYNKPKDINDIVNHSIGRILKLAGIENKLLKNWQGLKK